MNRLKELRKTTGFTQKSFSKEIGIPLRTLQNWENGESNIKPEKAKLLADYFGVSISVLLGYRSEHDSLGFRLWSLRNKKGIELEKVASDLKLSVDELKLIEQTDNAGLGTTLAKDFANYYNVSVIYLMGYSDKKEPYYDDEILFDDGSGGAVSLSEKRDSDITQKYNEQLFNGFEKFLNDFNFVISDSEIENFVKLLSYYNVNNMSHPLFLEALKRQNINQSKKFLKDNGYSKLGDNFQSTKAFDDFKKSLGYDTDHIL